MFHCLLASCVVFTTATASAQDQPPPTTQSADDAAVHDLLFKFHDAVANNDRKSFDACFVQTDGMAAFLPAALDLNRAGEEFADAAVKAYGEKSLDEFKHVEWKQGAITQSFTMTIPPRDAAAIKQIVVEINGDRARLPNGEMMVALARMNGKWLIDPSAGQRSGGNPDDMAALLEKIAKIMRDGVSEAAAGKISAHDLALEMAQKMAHLFFG